jgi:hypothetical protein
VSTSDPAVDTYDLPPLPDARVSVVLIWPAVPLADTAGAEEPAGTVDHDAQDRRAAAEERNARPRPSDY